MPCSPPGDLPDPGTEPRPPAAPALAGRPFTAGLPGTPFVTHTLLAFYCCLNSLPTHEENVLSQGCGLEVWRGRDGTRSKLARALVPSLGSRERALSRFQLPELLALLGSGPSPSSGQQECSPLEGPSALKDSGIWLGPPGRHRPSLRLQILRLSTSAKPLSPCKATHFQSWGSGRSSLAGGAYSVYHDSLKKTRMISHPEYLKNSSCCLVAKSCPILWDPMDCSPPDSSIHGILQARIPEWVSILFSRGSSPSK